MAGNHLYYYYNGQFSIENGKTKHRNKKMLIQFNCKTAATVSMHESYAKKMLKLMKLSGKVPSALQTEDMKKALDHLQQGLKIENDANNHASNKGNDEISLNTRAYPLIQLLTHAVKKEEYIMWDYDNGFL